MTTNPSEDYYDILGVPHNATSEQIHQAKIKNAKDAGLDRLYGKENQYKDSGEEDLLKAIRTQIKIENEKMKLVNEAYEVLSNTSKKKAYDEARRSTSSSRASAPPPRQKPEIILSTDSLNFGVVTKGGNKVKSFTIENRGGPPDKIPYIDWERDVAPIWGELEEIVADSIHTFPIKVTVRVETEDLEADYYSARIVVTVDGEEFGVSVSLRVVLPAPGPEPIPVSPTPKTTTTTPRPKPIPAPAYTPPPAAPTKVSILWVIFIGSIVTLGIVLVGSWVRTFIPGNPGQGSQVASNQIQNTQTPQFSFGQIYISSSDFSGDDWNYKVVFTIQNNSSLMVLPKAVYWGDHAVVDQSNADSGDNCYPPTNGLFTWLIRNDPEGPPNDGVEAHTIGHFECKGDVIHALVEPGVFTSKNHGPLCVLLFVNTEEPDAVFEYGETMGVAVTDSATICTP